jgi:hypothetical protein
MENTTTTQPLRTSRVMAAHIDRYIDHLRIGHGVFVRRRADDTDSTYLASLQELHERLPDDHYGTPSIERVSGNKRG